MEIPMRLLLAAATVALVLTACGLEPTPEPGSGIPAGQTPDSTGPAPSLVPPILQTSENNLITTPEYTGVILPVSAASKFSSIFSKPLTGYWEPSIDDIVRAEECIRRFLVSAQDDAQLDPYHRESAAFILSNLKDYRRQYLGITVGGEKRIWCNSFLSDAAYPDWEHTLVYVLDGGKYYWQIEYDLLRDECTNFHVHGEA
jgi:hypothetical protein